MFHGNSRLACHLCMTILCLTLAGTLSADEPAFPYVGYVQVESAVVRSGTGSPYYTTNRLPWAARVEVHRHDEEGWAAIRPPEGSFSWVRAEVLEPTGQTGLSRVTTSGVMPGIGSRYGDRRDTSHITLKAGEIVEVLGQRELPVKGDAEAGLWVKILPPAGEFRWVRLKDISQEPPTQVKQPPRSDKADDANRPKTSPEGSSKSITQKEAAKDTNRPASERPLVSVLVESSDSPDLEGTSPKGTAQLLDDGARAARVQEQIAVWESVDLDHPDHSTKGSDRSRPIGTYAADDRAASLASGFREVTPRSNGADGPVAAERDHTRAAANRDLENNLVPPPANPTLGVGQERSADELARVDLALTQTILRDPPQWELRSLRERAQAVIDTSDSADLRQHGRNLLATIGKFEDLQRRHLQLLAGDIPGIPSRSSAMGSDPATPPGSVQTGIASLHATEPHYDGKGWLMPVVTRRSGTPHYALTDDSGNILQFVTPQRGVNLRKYERRRIAVFGQQGYLPQLNKPHLTARRIISLDAIR